MRGRSRDLVGSIEPRWSHAQAVSRGGEDLVAARGLDERLAVAAWLHDVGCGQAINQRGFHPVDGAVFLQQQGAQDDIVALVAWHTGAAWEAEKQGLRSELDALPLPTLRDLDVLTLVDLTMSPTGVPITDVDLVAEILTRYEESDPVHRAVTRSQRSLLESSRRVQMRLGCIRTGRSVVSASLIRWRIEGPTSRLVRSSGLTQTTSSL